MRVLGGEPDLRLGIVRSFRSVVGQEHEHGAFVFAGRLQVRDQAPDMVVHRVGHGGVDLHLARMVAALRFAEHGPAGAGAHGGESGILRHQPEACGPVAPLLAQRVPAGVVPAALFGDEGLRRLYRHMVGLERDIGEERLAAGLAGVDVVDRPVDKIRG